MIKLHCSGNQLKIGKTMGVLNSFVWNYVKYANKEGFCRDSHIKNKGTHIRGYKKLKFNSRITREL